MLACLLGVAACQPAATDPADHHTVPIAICSKLAITGPIDLDLQQSETASLISSAVLGELLKQEDDWLRLAVPDGDSRLSVQVLCPRFAEIRLRGEVVLDAHQLRLDEALIAGYGRARIRLTDVFANELAVRVSGTSQVDGQAITADVLTFGGSGGGAASFNGMAERMQIEMTAQSTLAADQLRVQTIDVSAAGHSDASLWPTAHLGGKVRQNAQVRYRAGADVSVALEGNAKLTPLDP